MGKFCTKCGAPLEAGMRFCTKCGAPIVSEGDRDTSGIDRMADGSKPQSHVRASQLHEQPTPAQSAAKSPSIVAPTMQMPTTPTAQQPYVPANAEQVRYAQASATTQKRGLSSTAKAIIAAAIIVLIGAIVAVLIILHPWDTGSPVVESDANTSQSASSESASSESSSSSASRNESSTSSGSSRDSSSATSDSSASSSAATTSDADAKTALNSMLSRIDAFNTRVANNATNYNNHILGSATERQSGYNSALSLQREIESAISELNGLTIQPNSHYYEAWTLEKRLLDDLYHRIYVIQKGWERSLSSDDIDYINEYIAADNVNGINRYKSDYDETRPRVSIPD